MDWWSFGWFAVVVTELFVEGGGDSSSLRRRCKREFSRLLRKSVSISKTKRLKITASGGRSKAFRQFKTALASAPKVDSVLLLIDSEDRVAEVERTWDHLRKRDGWSKPRDSEDEHVMLMTTSMETWIVADRDALRERYGRHLRENALPSLVNLENRFRDDVLLALQNATNSRYKKGEESFTVLGKLNPGTLEQHLPSFRRARKILNGKLGS